MTSWSKLTNLPITSKNFKFRFSTNLTKVPSSRVVTWKMTWSLGWNKLKFWPLNGQAPVVWLQMGPILPTGWQLHSESIFTKREIFLDQKNVIKMTYDIKMTCHNVTWMTRGVRWLILSRIWDCLPYIMCTMGVCIGAVPRYRR